MNLNVGRINLWKCWNWILLPCLVKNAKHDIIDIAKPITKKKKKDIAKPKSLRLLRMVEPPGPVESDISVAMVELDGGTDGPAGRGLTESEQA